MNTLVLFLVGVLAVVWADKAPAVSYGPPPSASYGPPQVPVRKTSEEVFEPAKYGYGYTVQDGETSNDFAHQEDREDENTKGSYSVQLPDGRRQIVSYYVDGDSGYVVDVKYEGEARYPDSSEIRSYEPPRPRYSAPKKDDSKEVVPVYVPPRPRYTAPKKESEEAVPVYTPPRTQHFAPQQDDSEEEAPVYTPPRTQYFAPQQDDSEEEAPVYTPPRPRYSEPQEESDEVLPVYGPPSRSYGIPE
ncbi:cuticle protein 8 [Cherax quadricarinatus]|uniref:cuticle protein 8 n=1 Tax=Cherax quadricarinatus TaxID=27406 RepID=UPI002378B716|nr:cuticle protein 19.8-like [Cherax quadricarinatus]